MRREDRGSSQANGNVGEEGEEIEEKVGFRRR